VQKKTENSFSIVVMSESPNVKIWIGNIDTKLNEFQLLKIAEKFGKISSYDFLYHINDRGGRFPRGYAFVTYESAESAADAIDKLHKKKILTKELVVRYATAKGDPNQKMHEKVIPAALKAGRNHSLTDDEKYKKIRALEAKLKLMESNSEATEFKLNTGHSSSKSSKVNPY